LSIHTISSEQYLEPVEQGKCIAGAEFCAPINAMFGHVAWLADQVDYIFLPIMLEARANFSGQKKSFCYYTQYSSSLAASTKNGPLEEKCLLPLIYHSNAHSQTKKQLWKCLQPILGRKVSRSSLFKAFDEAEKHHGAQKQKLTHFFEREFNPDSNISVVLTGRPYVVLSPAMNKGIPDIFSKMGIKTFYQDMIPAAHEDFADIDPFLERIPWHYAVNILRTAKIASITHGLFPVLITAFKCAPDSFIIEYFKKILDAHHKPYLILQIDEHQSSTGFETRIEAAIRTFKNHVTQKPIRSRKVCFHEIFPIKRINNKKTLLFPNWDPMSGPLLVANLQRSGIDARLLQSDPMIIKRAMATNTGQCLPLNIIVQEFIEYIQKHELRPEDTMLWMMEGLMSCNLRQFPYYMKALLNDYGKGMEKASIYSGKVTHLDISLKTCYYAYFAHLFGGLLRKMGCKYRPYEIVKGTTDGAIDRSLRIFEQAFLGKKDMEQSVVEVLSIFDGIARTNEERPKVAIFGDLFVRDNDVMNQDLVHAIEEAGGEVITTPYTDYVKITSESAIRRRVEMEMYLEVATIKTLLFGLDVLEKIYYKPFKKYLGERPVIDPGKLEKNLSKFNLTKVHSGESYDNILKIFYLLENNPDIALFVQTNPAYCCPSLITESMTHKIMAITGIPIVTLTYDGTYEYINNAIIPYLHFSKGGQLARGAGS
jgi:predicted nucleotide-binding protein (sugar kinase/HSP70/actin superfamily)